MKEVDVIFTIFISLYYVLMVPMGGAAEFGAINLTEEDLTLRPDLDTFETEVYHLQDDVESMENVQFYNLSDVDGDVGLFTSTDDYDINVVVGRDTTGGESNITYDVSNWDTLDILATERSLEAAEIQLVFVDNNQTQMVEGATSVDVPDGETQAAFRFDPDDESDTDSYLYFLEGQSGTEFDGLLGAVAYFLTWVASGINYVISLAQIAAGLPFYLNVPFGLYFGYAILQAISFFN